MLTIYLRIWHLCLARHSAKEHWQHRRFSSTLVGGAFHSRISSPVLA